MASLPTRPVPLSRFLCVSLVSQIFLAIPFMLAVWAMGASLDLFARFLVGPFFFLGAPLVASFSWMVVKGSNWTNTQPAAILVAGHAIQLYVILAALLVVIRYMGTLSVWMYAGLLVSVIVARRLLVAPYARILLHWLAPELLVDRPQSH